jgi:hypothetical protein
VSRDGGEPLVVEIGTGNDAFTTLPDGGPVTLAHGAQGGTHIWTSVRVVDSRSAHVGIRLTNLHLDPDAGFVATEDYPYVRCVGLTPSSGSPQERVGITNFFYGPQGDVVLMKLDVAAPDGRVGHDVRMVTVQ